jgi:hypothetical protein
MKSMLTADMQVANYSGRRAYPRIDERGTWSA